ncbi:uracil-DNA glycosylase family protein [Roseobacter sp. S98]|uniref:uracil-DNA glycosylase family protein n=1 Tax=Roseobacter algicola (ex Choi et al. 2025) (nom. illeg.) TaxID=3092138 RepID=UPI0035C77685
MKDVVSELAACALCSERFAETETAHSPRPIIWFRPGARVLIAGQAPGMRVHLDGRPFTDPSGDRLREWLQTDPDTFYDRERIAIVPMAFCFPGYDARGSDLPPPPVCARTWRAAVLDTLPRVAVTLVIGGYAMKYHLGKVASVTAAVREQPGRDRGVWALPHPSWRNTGWLKKNPWFEAEILPDLRQAVHEALYD